MQVAAIYDIHGNLPALDAVLEDILRAGAERIVVGGDVVPGPMPRQCLTRLLDLKVPIQFILGNGEMAVLAEREGKDSGVAAPYRAAIQWNAAQLHLGDRDLLASWPQTLHLEIDGLGKVLFCHATPRNPNDIFTRLTEDARIASLFGTLDVDMVVCGHTHMQFDRTIGSVRVVNAGSVGMPFGQPGAYWLLLNSQVDFCRTEYDFEKAAAQIRLTQYPEAKEFAAHNVLRPPSEEKMLQAFAQT
jgi:predicted phosphodiesterase